MKKNFNGFTMIELLITMAIIGTLSAALFFNYGPIQDNFTLQKSAQKLAQDLRRIQEMAMAAEKEKCNGSETSNFGVYFNTESNNKYIIFADCDNSKTRNEGDIDVEKISLEKKVEISVLSLSPLNVVFIPPDPTTLINNDKLITRAEVTLSLGDNKNKTVEINNAGRIVIK